MNADDLTRIAYYAGETKAVLTVIVGVAVIGWSVAVYMTILYWLLKPRAKKLYREVKDLTKQNERLIVQVNRQQGELNELATLHADTEYLKDQYRSLDINHDILNANHEALKATALRYKAERTKSEATLIHKTKLLDQITRRTAALIQHVDLPVADDKVK